MSWQMSFVLYAHLLMYSHLRNLFRLIVKHGHVPQNFQLGVIISIIKDNRRDKNDVDNYRPVTIIAMISKVFEMCIYGKICNNLNVLSLQFGFVKEGGCDKSLFTVTKVGNYFLKRHSDVFIFTLDASNAFDKVNVYGLLTKLIDRDVSFDVVRVWLSWYVNTRACVRLNSYCTDYNDIKSEVKQWGIMTPMLYNI